MANPWQGLMKLENPFQTREKSAPGFQQSPHGSVWCNGHAITCGSLIDQRGLSAATKIEKKKEF
jgi:hypothetical protein